MLLVVYIINNMWNIAVPTFSMSPRRSMELRWTMEEGISSACQVPIMPHIVNIYNSCAHNNACYVIVIGVI
jgi:hypothetical protein